MKTHRAQNHEKEKNPRKTQRQPDRKELPDE